MAKLNPNFDNLKLLVKKMGIDVSLDEAEQAGYASVCDGSNITNSGAKFFTSAELKDAWERGRK